MSKEVLRDELWSILEENYHHRHPFNVRMHNGELSPEEIRTWVQNRYYYQTRIPIKDGLIISKTEDPVFRREWIRRIKDHEGDKNKEGGLELWLKLAEGVGLDRDEVATLHNILPGVRRSCDSYVEFVSGHNLLESVASSLTELFAGNIMNDRIIAFEKHYSWINPQALDYFRSRTQQAPQDAQEGLSFIDRQVNTDEERSACVNALTRKCEILWKFLDSIEWAHSHPQLSKRARLRTKEDLIILPEKGIELNRTGKEILDLCDGNITVVTIASEIQRRHPRTSQVESDVYLFLESMGASGALEFNK